MKYLVTHKKTKTVLAEQFSQAQKDAYESHNATRGLYVFTPIELPKAIVSLDEDSKTRRKRQKPK